MEPRMKGTRLKPGITTLKRTKMLNRESERRKWERPARRATSAAVIKRDGRCILAERLKAHPDFPPHVCGGPLVPNHAWKSGQGGPYTEDNLDAVCWLGNSWIEEWPIEAKALGLVR